MASSSSSTRPTHFIAVQITSEEVRKKVNELQKTLLSKKVSWCGHKSMDAFRDAMVPLARLHFTLNVVTLNGDEDIERAQNVLAECCSEMQQEFLENPLDLNIQGLGHFSHRILFAKVENDGGGLDRLTNLSNLFRKKFTDLAIRGDQRDFEAHLTIANVAKLRGRNKIPSFPPDIWSGFENMEFGVQRVTGVQLLSMAGMDKETGYYPSLGQYDFFKKVNDSSEESRQEPQAASSSRSLECHRSE